MADRLLEAHDPSRSPALHFKKYILSSNRSASATKAKPRRAKPESNQYFQASIVSDALSSQGYESPSRDSRSKFEQSARRGVLRLSSRSEDGALLVTIESLTNLEEVGRIHYQPSSQRANKFTHALCQVPRGGSDSPFAVAYVSTAVEDKANPLQFYVNTGGDQRPIHGPPDVLPKDSWKWRDVNDVRVFALEPLDSRTRGCEFTFAFLVCERDQLWYIQLDCDSEGGSLSARDSVRLQLPKEDLPADNRWQSKYTFGLYASLVGPPINDSISVAAVCSDEDSIFCLVRFEDRSLPVSQHDPLAIGETVEVQVHDKRLWRNATVTAVFNGGEEYGVRFQSAAASRHATERVTKSRIRRQNYTCYQFLRRTHRPMPEPRLRLAGWLHGGSGGNEMELSGMVPSISRGETFALFVTFVSRRNSDGEFVCRVRKLGVVGGGDEEDEDASAASSYIREFELDKVTEIRALAAIESEAVIVWTDQDDPDSRNPAAQFLYVTRADFPNDGVFGADFPNEGGNPGGFVNALSLPFGKLIGEVAVDSNQEQLLLHFERDSAFENSNILVRLGLKDNQYHQDLMGLMAPPSYHVTQAQFESYIFSEVLGGDNYPPTHLAQMKLKYNQLRNLRENQFVGKSHTGTPCYLVVHVFAAYRPHLRVVVNVIKGTSYLDKVMERVKYAIDVCTCLSDIRCPNGDCDIHRDRYLTVGTQTTDLLAWTGVDAILQDMKIVPDDKRPPRPRSPHSTHVRDEETRSELEFMDATIAVLRRHAFDIASHCLQHKKARPLVRLDARACNFGGRSANDGSDASASQARPDRVYIDSHFLCLRYTFCVQTLGPPDEEGRVDTWCRTFDAADLLQRLFRDQRQVNADEGMWEPPHLEFSFYPLYVQLLESLHSELVKMTDHASTVEGVAAAANRSATQPTTPQARRLGDSQRHFGDEDDDHLSKFENLVKACVERGFRGTDDPRLANNSQLSPLQLLIKIAPFKTVMGVCARDEALVAAALNKYLANPPVLSSETIADRTAPADFVLYYHASKVGTERADLLAPRHGSRSYLDAANLDSAAEREKWELVLQYSGDESVPGRVNWAPV